jgi:spermidine synthase
MDNPLHKKKITKSTLLLLSVFVIATCGLIYELVAGTLASYLLGDSITQFSTIIGTYLFAMGIGSYLSRYLNKNLIVWFIQIELLVGLIGGFSSTVLFLVFDQVVYFRVILYAIVSLTGMFVGLEIPILMRILKEEFEFKDLVSEVFTFDYIGALLASLIFPLFFVPHVGLIRTSLFFGLINTAVALWVIYSFKHQVKYVRSLISAAWLVFLLMVTCFIFADYIQHYTESIAYHDKIIISKSSPYQRIVVTNNKNELRLYINGNLQFSTLDEYRYHESLVHPIMSNTVDRDTVLVMGGGDGMAVRELLKYPEIKKIILVDLDPEMTKLFKSHPALSKLNNHSFSDSRVEVINDDAFIWALNQKNTYSTIIIDFPDPSNFSLGKLYSSTFYNRLYQLLKPNGCTVIQSTSPYCAPLSFWCVNATLKKGGFNTLPYHTYIPSFGEWGYIIGYKEHFNQAQSYPTALKYISPVLFEQMCFFSKDMSDRPVEINRLNNQVLVQYFDQEWSKFVQ